MKSPCITVCSAKSRVTPSRQLGVTLAMRKVSVLDSSPPSDTNEPTQRKANYFTIAVLLESHLVADVPVPFPVTNTEMNFPF